jgi:hypothetical protein
LLIRNLSHHALDRDSVADLLAGTPIPKRALFGIGRLCPVPAGPLAFAVLAFDSGFQCLGHGLPFLQLSDGS